MYGSHDSGWACFFHSVIFKRTIMATHECPDGYTPIRHHNTANFLPENIRDEHGQYWNPLEAAAEKCDSQDTCDGLLVQANKVSKTRYLTVIRSL